MNRPTIQSGSFLLQTYNYLPITIKKAKGSYVTDVHGKRYLDMFFQNREQFKTFEHFFPSLKLFLNRTVDLMEHYYCPKYDLIRPRIVAKYPEFRV